MSLLTHLRRKKLEDVAPVPQAECPHWELAPRWDSPKDMGQVDRATHFICTNCGTTISLEQARRSL
jgi:hypothetical protein